MYQEGRKTQKSRQNPVQIGCGDLKMETKRQKDVTRLTNWQKLYGVARDTKNWQEGTGARGELCEVRVADRPVWTRYENKKKSHMLCCETPTSFLYTHFRPPLKLTDKNEKGTLQKLLSSR